MARQTKTQIRNKMKLIHSVDEIAYLNTQAGFYFFTPDTMRFFAGKVYDEIWKIDKRGGEQRVLFLSSEKKSFTNYGRRYAVNVFDPATNRVETHRRMDCRSLEQARRLAKEIFKAQEIPNKEED